MKFSPLFFAAFFLFQKAAEAQSGFCAADFFHQKSLAEDADFAQKMAAFEAFWVKTMENGGPPAGDRAVVTVPVVFHVVHQNGPENISDARILEGLEHLNWAFSNSNFYDKGSGAAVEIQFCLATQNPDGAATTGINRVASPLTDHGYENEQIALKKVIVWDPTRFINIWVVRKICQKDTTNCAVAAYATLPGEHGKPTDGIVIEAEFVGGPPVSGVALAHEMGHYFGLLHTFSGGCANGNCLSQGDAICDTPPDNSTAAFPCAAPPNTCSTDANGPNSPFSSDQNDMIQNFMDYGNWACQHDFTAGQAARMSLVVKNNRKTLLASTGCKPPCAAQVVADFSFPSSIVEVGATVVFQNMSANSGASEWQIDGSIVATTQNLTHQFLKEGTFEIMLVAAGATDNCQPRSVTKKITVICPVVAAFLAAEPPFPIAGDTIFLKNTTPALPNLTFSWKTNLSGGTASTAADFVFVPPAPGIFSVCLEAVNPFCADEKCAFFNIFDPLAACNPNYSGQLGAAASGGAGAMAMAADGSIFHANGRFQIQKLDRRGGIVEAWRIDTLPVSQIGRVTVDSDSMLLIGGQIASTDAFLMRFDPKKGKILWFRRFGAGQEAILDVIEKTAGGPFLASMTEHFTLVGGLSGRAKILEIDRQNGQILSSRVFETGNVSQFRRLLPTGDGGFFGFGHSNTQKNGLAKTRALLARIDAAGEVIFSNTSFLDTLNSARLMGVDLAMDSAVVVGLIFGSSNSTLLSGPDFWIQKNDLAGNLIWAKKIAVPSLGGAFIYPQDLRVAADGYYVYGISTKAFLMKISKDGEKIEWAVQFASTTGANQPFSPGRLIVDGLDILAIGASTNQTAPIFLNTDPIGLIAPGCQETQPMTSVISTVAGAKTQPILLEKKSSPTLEKSQTLTVAGLAASVGTCPTCARDCEEPPPINEQPVDCAQPTFLRPFFFDAQPFNFQKMALSAADSSIWTTTSAWLSGGVFALSKLDFWGQPIRSNTYELLGSPFSAEIEQLFPQADGGALVQLSYEFFGRIDSLGQPVWLKKLPVGLYIRTISPSKTGGGLVLSFFDGFILHRFNGDGEAVWTKKWSLPANILSFSIEKITELSNGDWLAFGSVYDFNVGGQARFAARIGADGAVKWARSYRTDFYSTIQHGFEFSDGGLLFLGQKQDFVGNIWGYQNFMLGATANGDAVFEKAFLDGQNNLTVAQKMPKSDAVLIVKGSSVFRISQNGTVEWGRSMPFSPADLAVLPDEKGIFLAGQGSPTCSPSSTFLLARADSLGTLGGCGDLENEIFLQENAFKDTILAVSTVDEPFLITSDSAVAVPVGLFSGTFSCSRICQKDSIPTVDPPPVFPPCGMDLAVRIDSFGCSGGATEFFLTVCNESDSTFFGEAVVGLFADHPLKNAAAAALADTLGLFLPSGACQTFSMKMENGKSLKTGFFWAFLAEKSAFSWPDAQPIDTSKVLKKECRKPNNLSRLAFSPPAPPVLELGEDRVLCGQSVVELRAPGGFWSYRWSDGSADSTLTATSAGLFWLEATDECGGVQRDSVRVVFDPATVFDLPDLVICRPTEVDGPVGFSKIEWSPAAFLSPEKGAKTTVEPPADGQFYTVFVTAENAAGCLSTDTFQVKKGATAFDLAVDPAAASLFLGNEIALEAQPSGGFSGPIFWEWSPAEGLDATDEKTVTAMPLETTVFSVTATDAAGCTTSASAVLTVTPCHEARFPNAFTPDGDGLNDFFDVFTEADCPCRVVSMEIFSRWGRRVFEKTDFKNGLNTGWDGLFEGKLAAPDVYIFKIELEFFDGTRLARTGDLTLLR